MDIASSRLPPSPSRRAGLSYPASRLAPSSFVDRVAQRVQSACLALAAWARCVGASTLDTLGSTSESVARRPALAGMNPTCPSPGCARRSCGVAGFVAACHAAARRLICAPPSFCVCLCACSELSSGSPAWTAHRARPEPDSARSMPQCPTARTSRSRWPPASRSPCRHRARCRVRGRPSSRAVADRRAHPVTARSSARSPIFVEHWNLRPHKCLSRMPSSAVRPLAANLMTRPGTSVNDPRRPHGGGWAPAGAMLLPPSVFLMPSPSCSPPLRAYRPGFHPREGRK